MTNREFMAAHGESNTWSSDDMEVQQDLAAYESIAEARLRAIGIDPTPQPAISA